MASFVPCCKRNSWWSLNVKLFYVKIYKNITETAKTHNRKLSILLLSMLLCCMNDSSVSRTFLIHIQRTSNKMATPKTTPTDMELKITVGLIDMVGRVQAGYPLILRFSLLFHEEFLITVSVYTENQDTKSRYLNNSIKPISCLQTLGILPITLDDYLINRLFILDMCVMISAGWL